MVKLHQRGDDFVLAACDPELLGKTISEGEIEININERFYKGEEVSEEEFRKLLQECYSANLVGKRTVEEAKKVYNLQRILYINEVPHVIIFKIR